MLGIRIKTLRQERKWSQSDLANKLGVSRTAVTEYERGRIIPPYEKIKMMSDLFGVTVKFLTGESNSRTDAKDSDPHDFCDTLNNMIDNLSDSTFSVKFNGKFLDQDSKSIAADELKNLVRTLHMLNK